jgi:hypothetical protein
MEIKTQVSDLSEVPEALRDAYVQRDGVYLLNLDGPPPDGYADAKEFASLKTKHEHSRDRGIGMLKEVAELAGVPEATDLAPLRDIIGKYRGLDVNEYERLKQNAAKLEESGVKQPEDFAHVVREQVNAAIEPIKNELEQERTARIAEQEKNASSRMREEISRAFLEAGGKPRAVDFMVSEASKIFEVREGQVQARAGQYSPKRAGEAVSVAEFMQNQLSASDFCFDGSAGGGAIPSNGSFGSSVKVLDNPTPQDLGKLSYQLDDLKAGKIKVANS